MLQGDCGPELQDDSQDRCNSEQQKNDRPTSDTGHLKPGLLRVSRRLSRSAPQQFGISGVTPEPEGEEIADNEDTTRVSNWLDSHDSCYPRFDSSVRAQYDRELREGFRSALA